MLTKAATRDINFEHFKSLKVLFLSRVVCFGAGNEYWVLFINSLQNTVGYIISFDLQNRLSKLRLTG